MSQVVSFRLDRDNPREAQALLVLSTWQERGYSLRHILTEALIRLDAGETDGSIPLEDLAGLMTQLGELVELLQAGSWVSQGVSNTMPGRDQLSDAFLTSVSKASRPGMRLK